MASRSRSLFLFAVLLLPLSASAKHHLPDDTETPIFTNSDVPIPGQTTDLKKPLASKYEPASPAVIPAHYLVPLETRSPDGRYGVTVPIAADDVVQSIPNPQNQIIELSTGRVLGAIKSADEYVAFDRMNHDGIVPALWQGNSVMLWQVNGRWGYTEQVLLQLADGKIKWQVDLLHAFRQAILARTQKAAPVLYSQVKGEGSDYSSGSWDQDGFTIDCVPDASSQPLEFPLLYHCFLTSNPKGDLEKVSLDARLTAEVSADGSIAVTDFYLGTDPPARKW